MGDIVMASRKRTSKRSFLQKNSLLPNTYDSPEMFKRQIVEYIENGVKKLKLKKGT